MVESGDRLPTQDDTASAWNLGRSEVVQDKVRSSNGRGLSNGDQGHVSAKVQSREADSPSDENAYAQ